MTRYLACVAVFVGVMGAVVACGSSTSGDSGNGGETASAGAGFGVGGKSSSAGAGQTAGGEQSQGGGTDEMAGANSTVGGADSTGGANSEGGTGGKSSGSAGKSAVGGATGSGGSGPAKGNWFCVQAGAICSCLVNSSVPAMNSCTQPETGCCFTFSFQGTDACQCQPTTQITCADFLTAVKGTKVAACPP